MPKIFLQAVIVSLFVRLWVEIVTPFPSNIPESRQPLREAVSWNCRFCVALSVFPGQPLREAVSWNLRSPGSASGVNGQPLREAVSWNVAKAAYGMAETASASSWGCELKYRYLWYKPTWGSQPLREAVSWNSVYGFWEWYPSGQPLREAVSWNLPIW